MDRVENLHNSRDFLGAESPSDTMTTKNTKVPCVIEKNIEKNFTTFRHYIEKCVKVTDLIVYYELFTTEQTKKLRQVYKSDPTAATSMAFDLISDMENQPDRYSRLLNAVKDAEKKNSGPCIEGYSKIVKILKGKLLPKGSHHRQILRKSFSKIYKDLIPNEVLPHLLSSGVIAFEDFQKIMATERNSTTGSAVLELLHILPNRHKDWYRHFIEALIIGSHEDLAKTIDEDMANSFLHGHDYKPRDRSCQNQGRFSDEELQEETSSIRSVRVHFDSDIPQRDVLSNGEKCQIPIARSYDCASPGIRLLKDCSPCQFGGISKEASYFCTDCTENLCDTCKICHSRMKVTRSHTIIECPPESSNDISPSMSKIPGKLECPCGLWLGELYCKTHDGIFCFVCSEQKHGGCDKCFVCELTGTYLANKMEDVIKDTEETISNLETILGEKDHALDQLSKHVRICKASISNAEDKIHALISLKTAKIITQLNEIGDRQKETLENQMQACRMSLEKMSEKYDYARKNLEGRETSEVLHALLQLVTTLKDVKTVDIATEKDCQESYKVFEESKRLFNILKTETLGDLEKRFKILVDANKRVCSPS